MYEKMKVHLDKKLLEDLLKYEPDAFNRFSKTPPCTTYWKLREKISEVLNDYELFLYENLVLLDFLAKKITGGDNDVMFSYVAIWDGTKMLAKELLEMVEDDEDGD